MLITCRRFQTIAEITLQDNCLLIYPPCHSFSCVCFGLRTRTHTMTDTPCHLHWIFSYSLFSRLTLIGNFFCLCVNALCRLCPSRPPDGLKNLAPHHLKLSNLRQTQLVLLYSTHKGQPPRAANRFCWRRITTGCNKYSSAGSSETCFFLYETF